MDLSVEDPLGDNTVMFGWPGSVYAFQPGLRLGCLPAGGSHEVFADAGYPGAIESGERPTRSSRR